MKLINNSSPRYLNEDAECITRILRNEESAYQVLYARYKHRIYRYIWLRIENKEDARDLTARTFNKAFTNLHKIKELQFFRQWLFKIAINEIRMYHRSLATKIKAESIEDTPEQELADNPDVSPMSQSVVWTLSKLSQQEQDILNYRLIQKKKIDEIAKMLGLSKQMVYYILRKATKKFSKIYSSKYKIGRKKEVGEKNEKV